MRSALGLLLVAVALVGCGSSRSPSETFLANVNELCTHANNDIASIPVPLDPGDRPAAMATQFKVLDAYLPAFRSIHPPSTLQVGYAQFLLDYSQTLQRLVGAQRAGAAILDSTGAALAAGQPADLEQMQRDLMAPSRRAVRYATALGAASCAEG